MLSNKTKVPDGLTIVNNPDVFEKFSKLLLSEIFILQFEDVFETNGIFIVFDPY